MEVVLFGKQTPILLRETLSNINNCEIGQNIFYIYVLTEPNSFEIRYVGLTKNPTKRYRQHLKGLKAHRNNHKDNWIKKLKSLNETPDIFVLDCFNGNVEEADKIETYYIEQLSNIFKLTNFLKNSKSGGKYFERLKDIGAKTVYIFDKNGVLIEKINTTTETTLKYKMSSQFLYKKINEKSLFGGEYFFSRNEVLTKEYFDKNKGVATPKKCFEFDENGNLLNIFDSYAEAEQFYNFPIRVVSKAISRNNYCRGKIFSNEPNFDVGLLKRKKKITKNI